MKHVTQAYLMGIREGRDHLKNFPELKDDRQTMQTLATNAAQLMRHHSGDMRELFKGERDFWRNQLRAIL